jgi:UDP-N-acetylmuramoyl-L-alanyl-D-glutamate--2,6-diaminopimelate ligase
MKLNLILKNLDGVKKIEGKASIDIKGVVSNSKAVKDGYLFIAVKGAKFDGAGFIGEAIDRGVAAVVSDAGAKEAFLHKKGPTFIYVDDAKKALSEISKEFYGDVSAKMRLIGVTGTNGKTTTTYLLESLIKKQSKKTGVIGTINYRFGDRLIPAANTTPGVLDLYFLLSSMLKKDIEDCVLEVSSHSLEQGRVDTLLFDIAVFTNLTAEHMDYHGNTENYLASKIKLFDKIKNNGHAVVNIDDPASEKIVKKVMSEKKSRLITYGIDGKADVSADGIEFSRRGLKFRLRTGEEEVLINSRLIGRHNVYNILAAAACGIAMGMSLKDICLAVADVVSLPGRMEKIDCGQDFLVFVDYAHTGNGLENALNALREMDRGRILCVFGCGGNRDRAKRPVMGRISAELADKVFITSDNPRNEDPLDIIKEIISGINTEKNNYLIEIDRFKAIEEALKEARGGDIVLIAGKGHETYQVFKDITLPFDDREAVKKILNRRGLCLQSKTS